MPKLSEHLSGLPTELADAVEAEFIELGRHLALREWDDAEVNAGRFSEAVFRVLEWQMTGNYTPIDGVHKPNRKGVASKAANDTALAPCLRVQVPIFCEQLLDFRNNRNAAHLGGVDPGPIDGATVHQLASWIIAELARLYGKVTVDETQSLLNELAQRPNLLIYSVAGVKIVLSKTMSAGDKALVLLASESGLCDIKKLAGWCQYKNLTRWRDDVMKKLAADQYIYLDSDIAHLLPGGSNRADKLVFENS